MATVGYYSDRPSDPEVRYLLRQCEEAAIDGLIFRAEWSGGYPGGDQSLDYSEWVIVTLRGGDKSIVRTEGDWLDLRRIASLKIDRYR